MVVIKAELWPGGDKNKARDLGVMTIANVGGDDDHGDYQVRIMKGAAISRSAGTWKVGQVFRFPRLRLGPWDLLYRALHATVRTRNLSIPDATTKPKPKGGSLEEWLQSEGEGCSASERGQPQQCLGRAEEAGRSGGHVEGPGLHRRGADQQVHHEHRGDEAGGSGGVA